MMTVLVKSTVGPLASVSLPSSRIWRKRLKTASSPLLHLVEEHDAVRPLHHLLREMPSFLIPNRPT